MNKPNRRFFWVFWLSMHYFCLARFMFKVLSSCIDNNFHWILVVSGNTFYFRPNFTVFSRSFCFEFIGKLGNLMNNLRFVNVLNAFPCLKMMSNLPPFFSYSLFFAVALRNFTIHLKTQLILKEATPNCIWLDYYYLFSGLSAYYLEFLCISQSCVLTWICPVTIQMKTAQQDSLVSKGNYCSVHKTQKWQPNICSKSALTSAWNFINSQSNILCFQNLHIILGLLRS